MAEAEKNGIQFSLTGDDQRLLGTLQRLHGQGENLEPALNEIGSMLQASTQRRIELELGPDGRKWPDLAESTRQKRGADAKMLRDSGDLVDSIVYMASRDDVRVGSAKDQARIMHLGGEAGRKSHRVTIPARPHYGADAGDLEEIDEIMRDHFGGLLV